MRWPPRYPGRPGQSPEAARIAEPDPLGDQRPGQAVLGQQTRSAPAEPPASAPPSTAPAVRLRPVLPRTATTRTRKIGYVPPVEYEAAYYREIQPDSSRCRKN